MTFPFNRLGYAYRWPNGTLGPLVDPLLLVKEAAKKGLIPEAMVGKAESRMKYLRWAVEKVEKATKVKYPLWYVVPYVMIMEDSFWERAILYARNRPVVSNKALSFSIEFTLPLHLFSSKDTLLAVAAHEFTHYAELARRISEFEVMTSEISNSVFEATYRDVEESLQPELVFGRYRSIIRLLREKFPDGLEDDALNSKTIKRWIQRELPVLKITPEENVIRIPVESLTSVKLDPALLALIKKASAWP